MKKQVFGMAAALFALMLALFVGAYAADTSTDMETAALNAADNVYAILYEDGTLVFQHGNTPEPGKTATNTYEVDLDKVYTDYSYPSSNYAPWYNERKSVRVVNFADKISPTATAWWFCDCSNLERVDNIQNLDTANVTDMSVMFWYCCRLTALDVSHFDTKNVTDMSEMFDGCSGLMTLDVSHFDTKNVTDMSEMFDGCSGLMALDVSKFNTKNVTNMSEMFYGCSGLMALDLSKFDTANVTTMYCMFYGCSGLTALDLFHFDTKNVTDMSAMFVDCSGLMTLDLSHFDTAKVQYMSSMFYGCSGLTALDMSHFDTANVTNMHGMFCGCSGLKTIYASDKFKTASVTNDSLMFKDCTSLVGGNGTKYDESRTDKEYARIDTPSAPGYFTAKDAPAPVPYEITALIPNADTKILTVKLTNPAAATVFVSYFDTKGQFVSAPVQSVQANAGTVTLPLSAGTRKACVMLFDNDCRPLCVPFAVDIK